MGAWCGYVGVREDHPFYRKDYDARVPGMTWKNMRGVAIGKRGIIPVVLAANADEDSEISICTLIDVLGSLTYSGEGVVGLENEKLWWFGFDTGHYGDLVPRLGLSDGVYRDLEYVKEETRRLAEQLSTRISVVGKEDHLGVSESPNP
jgi:hypothetical protein